MLHLDDNTKKQKGLELEEKIRTMKPPERENYLEECADFYLLLDEDTTNYEMKYF